MWSGPPGLKCGLGRKVSNLEWASKFQMRSGPQGFQVGLDLQVSNLVWMVGEGGGEQGMVQIIRPG